MNSCSLLQNQLQEIQTNLQTVEELSKQFVSTGNFEYGEKLKQLLKSITDQKESFFSTYQEKVTELLEQWQKNYDQQLNLKNLTFTSTGRLEYDNWIDLSDVPNGYLPSLFRKVEMLNISSNALLTIEEIGNLVLDKTTLEFYAPKLKELGYTDFHDLTNLDLPVLEKGYLRIWGDNTVATLPLLKEGHVLFNCQNSELLDLPSYEKGTITTNAASVQAPKLETSELIKLHGTNQNAFFPALNHVDSFIGESIDKLNIQSLQKGNITLYKATTVDMSNTTEFEGVLSLYSTQEIKAPLLQRFNGTINISGIPEKDIKQLFPSLVSCDTNTSIVSADTELDISLIIRPDQEQIVRDLIAAGQLQVESTIKITKSFPGTSLADILPAIDRLLGPSYALGSDLAVAALTLVKDKWTAKDFADFRPLHEYHSFKEKPVGRKPVSIFFHNVPEAEGENSYQFSLWNSSDQNIPLTESDIIHTQIGDKNYPVPRPEFLFVNDILSRKKIYDNIEVLLEQYPLATEKVFDYFSKIDSKLLFNTLSLFEPEYFNNRAVLQDKFPGFYKLYDRLKNSYQDKLSPYLDEEKTGNWYKKQQLYQLMITKDFIETSPFPQDPDHTTASTIVETTILHNLDFDQQSYVFKTMTETTENGTQPSFLSLLEEKFPDNPQQVTAMVFFLTDSFCKKVESLRELVTKTGNRHYMHDLSSWGRGAVDIIKKLDGDSMKIKLTKFFEAETRHEADEILYDRV